MDQFLIDIWEVSYPCDLKTMEDDNPRLTTLAAICLNQISPQCKARWLASTMFSTLDSRARAKRSAVMDYRGECHFLCDDCDAAIYVMLSPFKPPSIVWYKYV